MSNAVIYARYSSGHQREESIEGQIRECTNFAKRNGLTIVEHYKVISPAAAGVTLPLNVTRYNPSEASVMLLLPAT